MEVRIRDLAKTYPNGVHALQGPNGAGESTLVRTLASLQEKASAHGRARWTPPAR